MGTVWPGFVCLIPEPPLLRCWHGVQVHQGIHQRSRRPCARFTPSRTTSTTASPSLAQSSRGCWKRPRKRPTHSWQTQRNTSQQCGRPQTLQLMSSSRRSSRCSSQSAAQPLRSASDGPASNFRSANLCAQQYKPTWSPFHCLHLLVRLLHHKRLGKCMFGPSCVNSCLLLLRFAVNLHPCRDKHPFTEVECCTASAKS